MKYELELTDNFEEWLKNLKDRGAVLAITKRLTRLAIGNFGDSKSVGGGVYELRFFIGPGYRVYYGIERERIILLLNGGDKSSQVRDIKKAKKILFEFKGEIQE